MAPCTYSLERRTEGQCLLTTACRSMSDKRQQCPPKSIEAQLDALLNGAVKAKGSMYVYVLVFVQLKQTIVNKKIQQEHINKVTMATCGHNVNW